MTLAPRASHAIPIGVDVHEGHFDILSRYVWRGYDLAKGPVLAPRLEIGLAGNEVAGIGQTGIMLELSGDVPVRNHQRQKSANEFDAGLWLHHGFGGEGSYRIRKNELRLGYVEYRYPSGRAGHESGREIAGEISTESQFLKKDEATFLPYLAAAYNFGAFDAPYVALGARQELGTTEKAVFVDLRVSASRFRTLGATGPQAFALHNVQLEIKGHVERRKNEEQETTLLIEPSVGVSRAVKRIDRDSHEFWLDVSIGFKR